MEENGQILKQRAQELRRNMTKEECRLWYQFLRKLPLRVHRQKVIAPYIVDFYIAEKQLVIELDGTQHFLENGQAYDRKRDAFLKERGLRVLRYANNQVNQEFKSVCEDIWNACFGCVE